MYTQISMMNHNRPARRQRGSTLLLVVAVLLMVLILGMAYLQIVRQDRLAAANLPIKLALDSVTSASIEALAQVLGEDRIDIDPNSPTFGQLFMRNGSPEEAYDYPGDQDKHLSTTAPNISGGVMTWPQIALVGDRYANNTAPAQPTDRQGIPVRDIDTVTGEINQPSGVYSDADGDGIIDAKWERASIPELGSLLWYVSYRVVDNSSLLDVNVATAMTSGPVGAVGSSPPNSDTAFGTVTDLPRGYNPAHLDLTRLLRRGPGTWQAELTKPTAADPGLLFFRGLSTTIPTMVGINDVRDPLMVAGGSISEAWWGRLRVYGSSTNKLGIENELEMRFHGGLNNASAIAEIEKQFPTALQRDDTQASYKYAGSTTGATTIQQYLLGVTNLGANPPTTVSDRRFPSVRQFLTTRSGADDFLPDYLLAELATLGSPHDIVVGNSRHRYDLSYQDGGADPPPPPPPALPTPDVRAEAIAQRVLEILSMGNPKYFEGPPVLWTGTLGDTQRALFAYQIGAAAQDYSDEDSNPTLVEVKDAAGASLTPPLNVAGMEKLPFLREVYIQAGYRDQDDPDPVTGDMDPTTFDAFVMVPDSQAMAFEIGNPFNQNINIDTTTPVKIVIREGGTDAFEILLNTLTDTLGPRDDSLDSTDDLLILYANPATPIAENDASTVSRGTDLATDLDFGGAAHLLPIGAAPFAADAEISVELRVEVIEAGGAKRWVTYDRMRVAGFLLPEKVPHAPNMVQAPDAHGQRAMARPGEKIHYIGPVSAGVYAAEIGFRSPDDTPASYRNRAGGDQLDYIALDAKGMPALVGNSGLDATQLTVPDRPFYSPVELGWMFSVGIVEDTTSGTVVTIPEIIDGKLTLAATLLPASELNKLYRTVHLDFRQTAPDSTDVTHAAMVLDRFTTLGGLYNLIDDDQDAKGTPPYDEDPTVAGDTPEMFIPGRLNVNTVPLHTATLGAPLPEALDSIENLMRAIIAYRDLPDDDSNTTFNEAFFRDGSDPTIRYAGLRSEKGIAGIAELLMVNPTFALPNTTTAHDMMAYGLNGTAEDATTPQINLHPMPEDGASEILGIEYREEEQLARLQFLLQTFTTRSDIYTGYIVVRGYRAGDLVNAVVQRRVVVVFDRSAIFDKSQPVKILGIYEE